MVGESPGGDPRHFELIEEHIHLVKTATARVEPLLPPEVDRGGLVGAGIVALLETVWQTPSGCSDTTSGFFEQQAKGNIWRAIVRWMASQPWLVERLQSSADHLAEAYWRINRRHGAEAKIGEETLDELAAELEFTAAELDVWLREMDAYFTAWPRDFLGVAAGADMQEAVVEALSALDPHARTVVALMHFEELTLAEVAAVTGATLDEVLRTHARAGLQMRALLGEAAIAGRLFRNKAS